MFLKCLLGHRYRMFKSQHVYMTIFNEKNSDRVLLLHVLKKHKWFIESLKTIIKYYLEY